MNWYYLNESGEVVGPVSKQALKELNAAGALATPPQVCREGTEEWVTLTEVLGADALSGATEQARILGEGHAKGWKNRTPAIAVAAALILLLMAGSFFGLRMMGIGRVDSSTDKENNRPTDQGNLNSGAVFWKFQFGQAYDEAVATMKTLKAQGYFSNLGNVSGRKWLPEATKGIHAYGGNPTLLGDTLSIPCSGLFLFFKKDRLIGIELSFTFKDPSNHVAIQTRDMERVFGLESSYQDSEDELGNVTRQISLDGPKVRIEIVDRLDKRFAPSTKISSK